MDDLMALYQEVILDHNKWPRNFGELPAADHRAEGNNPLCGDQLTVYLTVAAGRIVDIRFSGQGCAISTASASLMTEALKGKSEDEAAALFEAVHKLLTEQGSDESDANGDRLGKLTVLGGIKQYPMRVKCASLPWHTLRAALERSDRSVTTE